MTKTIKQIADELNVDKQKVYRYIKKNHINEAHQTNGVMYYNETAQFIITQAFSQNVTSNESHQNHINEAVNDVVIEALMNQLDIQKNMLKSLEKQLTVKDEQITELEKQIDAERQHSREQSDKLAQLAENAQQLQKGQMVMNLDDSKRITEKVTEQKEKTSNHWWNNLFKK